jgi:uncharacterized protein YqgC (DUF456 family)
MNIFELAVFLVHCVAGYFVGRILASQAGAWGWIAGIPIGFAVSLSSFYFLARSLEKRPPKDAPGDE